jgi:hypothetical protein
VKSVEMSWVSGQHGRYKKLIQIFIRKTAQNGSFWSLVFRSGVMLDMFTLKWGLSYVSVSDP